MAGLAVPISSRKIVPPSACRNLPIFSPVAPVNEPATWPNSSLSSKFSGSAPQATSTNGPFARLLRRWIARAIMLLPVPLSPVTSTVARVSATLSIMSKTRIMCGSRPTTLSSPTRRSSWARRFVFSVDHRPLRERPLDRHQELVVDQRLGEIVERAGANRFDRAVRRAVARQQNHLRRRPVAAAMLEQIEAVAVAESHVAEHEVVRLAAQRLERVAVAGGRVEVVALAAEPVGHRFQHVAIVVDQ